MRNAIAFTTTAAVSAVAALTLPIASIVGNVYIG